jgi:hypothetical protein
MLKLVKSAQETIDNILHFEKEVERSTPLQNRLGYARAWYAFRDSDGVWHFGSSKFCGYASPMSAESYVANDDLNGRETERQLGHWFTEVLKSDALHAELDEALRSFLSQYGKMPSSAARINVTNEFYENHATESGVAPDRMVGDLLIAVARRLPQSERQRVRAAL